MQYIMGCPVGVVVTYSSDAHLVVNSACGVEVAALTYVYAIHVVN